MARPPKKQENSVKSPAHATASAFAVAAILLTGHHASAHGIVGQRFFPATLATEDPFVADELSLPTVSTVRNPPEGEDPATRETDVGVDISKRITPDFAIGIGETWQHLDPKGSSSVSGFGNLELNAKYLLLKNAPHEFLFSVGLDAEVGGTGSSRVGADGFSTLTPGVFFGKGMGDLPDGLKFLKPVAVTGSVGFGIPTSNRSVTGDGDVEEHPRTVETGLAIEYSLPYLQSAVQDIGLGAPFNRIIPLVEFSFSTAVNGGVGGQTTGTINPGFIWAGQQFQLGVEAIIPINDRSGRDVGGIAQLHFYLDDIFPKSIGKPLFD